MTKGGGKARGGREGQRDLKTTALQQERKGTGLFLSFPTSFIGNLAVLLVPPSATILPVDSRLQPAGMTEGNFGNDGGGAGMTEGNVCPDILYRGTEGGESVTE